MTIELKLSSTQHCKILFGENDKHLSLVESALGVDIFARGTQLRIEGSKPATQAAKQVIQELYHLVEEGMSLQAKDIKAALALKKEKPKTSLKNFFLKPVSVSKKNAHITPKTHTQKTYIDTIDHKDIVFGYGPAGTGKTYLAMAMAVSHLVENKVKRIILTRPAVEAGEKLGFLPGDLTEKVNPYLRPLYDALFDMMEADKAQRLIDAEVIEVAPLAFMRGRTLNQAFVILDEAQNTTIEQMKMFLTRLGDTSKMVINGDITQIDLPRHQKSGLRNAIHLLQNVKDIGFVAFSQKDVVRHPLVKEIINAYENALP